MKEKKSLVELLVGFPLFLLRGVSRDKWLRVFLRVFGVLLLVLFFVYPILWPCVGMILVCYMLTKIS